MSDHGGGWVRNAATATRPAVVGGSVAVSAPLVVKTITATQLLRGRAVARPASPRASLARGVDGGVAQSTPALEANATVRPTWRSVAAAGGLLPALPDDVASDRRAILAFASASPRVGLAAALAYALANAPLQPGAAPQPLPLRRARAQEQVASRIVVISPSPHTVVREALLTACCSAALAMTEEPRTQADATAAAAALASALATSAYDSVHPLQCSTHAQLRLALEQLVAAGAQSAAADDATTLERAPVAVIVDRLDHFERSRASCVAPDADATRATSGPRAPALPAAPTPAARLATDCGLLREVAQRGLDAHAFSSFALVAPHYSRPSLFAGSRRQGSAAAGAMGGLPHDVHATLLAAADAIFCV
jgi:hypothetical protein